MKAIALFVTIGAVFGYSIAAFSAPVDTSSSVMTAAKSSVIA